MFSVKVENDDLTVATKEDLFRLHIRENDCIHLGDHLAIADGLYIGKMSRGDLYRKYSTLDYDKIDFSVPAGMYDHDDPCVWYYGNEQHKIFGHAYFDNDVLLHIAAVVAVALRAGNVKELTI